MSTPMDLNREHWDESTDIHARGNVYGIEDFKAGQCQLHRIEVEELGDVSGKRLLHLQCHTDGGDGVAIEPGDRIGGLSGEEMARFLAGPWNARIATVTAEGWPYLTPVWYDFEPGPRRFLVVGRAGADWVAHICATPRVALHVADDVHAQHTRVLAQGLAEIVEGPVAPAASPRILELTQRLSLRYLGPNGPAYAERTITRPRVLVQITPTRWRTWTGGEWHPRYR